MYQKAIYLDYNASTPCADEVIDAMLPFFAVAYANPSSNSSMGRTAAMAVDDARDKIAALIGACEHEIIFTSGATESNNTVLRALSQHLIKRSRIVVFSLEHKSVLEPCWWLARQGADIVNVPCDASGVFDTNFAADCINNDTLMVCIQGANNEIGTIQPVSEIAEIAHSHGAFVHCDATQLLSSVPFSVSALGADSISLSAHKAYGPKGIGALVVRRSAANALASPLLLGGGQENQRRSGTVNVPAVVGFGTACELVCSRYLRSARRVSDLRNQFESHLIETLSYYGPQINGRGAERLPGTSNITLPGIPASMLIANTPNLAISEGSACESGAIEPSYVLKALGLSRSFAECSVRVCFGYQNTEEDVEEAIASIASAAARVLDVIGAEIN